MSLYRGEGERNSTCVDLTFIEIDMVA
jgi:hypothetical protein